MSFNWSTLPNIQHINIINTLAGFCGFPIDIEIFDMTGGGGQIKSSASDEFHA